MKPLKNSDLRVGNLIQSGNNGKPYEHRLGSVGVVLSIGSNDQLFEQIYCECEESYDWFFRDNYFGIPITDDILRQLKGKKEPMGYSFNISRFKEVEFNLMFSGDYLYITESVEGKNIPSDIICLWNKDIKKYFFLHDFQNLYYFITGKELNCDGLLSYLSNK